MAATTATWAIENGHAIWSGRPLSFWCDELVDDLVKVFSPVEVWLFGSVARGDDNGDSDLDLLVVLDHFDTSQSASMKALAATSSDVPAPFDVVFTDLRRLAARHSIAGTIERSAMRDGRRVYVR